MSLSRKSRRSLKEKKDFFKNSSPLEYKALLKTLSGCDRPMLANQEACKLLLDEQNKPNSVHFIELLTDSEWEEFIKQEVK